MDESKTAEERRHHGSAGEVALQAEFGTKDRAEIFYERQVLHHLNESMQRFISQQEMVFISTADAGGNCDCSLRAGLAGFVRVLSQSTITYPEYRGNGVLASLGNIHENPKIGMMFVDFYRDTIGLHVNGKAKIIENAELLTFPNLSEDIRKDLAVTIGRKPERWVLVEVEEAYIHCSKHIPLLKKLDKRIAWGTDDKHLKGGDYFGVQKKIDD